MRKILAAGLPALLLSTALLAITPAAPATALGSGAPLTAGSTTSTMPDLTGLAGTWTRTAEGGYTAVAAANQNAPAVGEQEVAGTARYTATVTVDPASPYGVGALLFRAAADASSGYAVTVDPNLDRLRLFDLATGQDVAAPVSVPLVTGQAYTVDVHLDGPRLHIELDGVQRFDVTDQRYTRGHVGLHAYNGTVRFGPPGVRTVETELDGWSADAGWQATSAGLRGAATSGANIRAVATRESPADLDFSTSVQLTSPYGVAAVLFRTDDGATTGYAAEVDPNAGRLRLYRVADNVTLGTYATTITLNKIYRLRVTATGSRLAVHWQTDFLTPNGALPVITATDSTVGSGHLGVLSYNGTAVFQALHLHGLQTSLQGWRTASGTWEPDPAGVRATAAATPAVRYVPVVASDVVVSLDLSAASPATASVVARSNTDGTGGTELRITPASGTAALYDRATGTVVRSGTLPAGSFASAAQPYRVQFTLQGGSATVLVDGVNVLSGTVPAAAGSGFALLATGGSAAFQNVRADAAGDYMNGLYQPGYHYSQNAGNASDPNGLVYFGGEYHLFHQDRGRWAHAVSTDLLHWKPLPIALPVMDGLESWSGSAVVDSSNASGLFAGVPGGGLVAFYTSFNHDLPNGNQSIRAAYSTDKGRSWRQVQQSPVVQNPGGATGGWDFRDPKVTWDPATARWVMTVSGGDHLRFYTSTDLKTWSFASTFGYGAWVRGGVWECPDLFQMPVEGQPGVTRWVLYWSTGAVRATNGSSAQYVTGTWDGATFTPDTTAAQVLQADHGRDYYAAMSFFGAPDGRRIQLGWMSNWDYAFSPPTGRWNGQLSIPRELKLVSVPGAGLRLSQAPVAEEQALRSSTWQTTDVQVTPTSANPLAAVSGRAVEVEAEVGLPAAGAASSFTFGLRQGGSQSTAVRYDAPANTVTVGRTASGRADFSRYFASSAADDSTAPWSTTTVGGEKRVTLRILVDASSVEVFGGDGTAAITSLVFPDPSSTGLSFSASGGTAHLVSVKVHQLADTFRLGGVPQSTVPPQSPLAPFTGTARQNLGPYSVVPGGRWESTGAGLSGTFDQDSTALGQTTLADVRVQATARFGTVPFTGALLGQDPAPERGYGGAGSILLRSSADGSTAYYVNVDPNLGLVRVFAVINGSLDPATGTLASVPLPLAVNTSYRVDASIVGNRITVSLDGSPLIDVTDSRLTSGRVGLNSFGGRAAYQDVVVTPL